MRTFVPRKIPNYLVTLTSENTSKSVVFGRNHPVTRKLDLGHRGPIGEKQRTISETSKYHFPGSTIG